MLLDAFRSASIALQTWGIGAGMSNPLWHGNEHGISQLDGLGRSPSLNYK